MTSGNRRRRRPRDEITIQLTSREDRDGKTYYVAWPDAPATINLQECVLFVFVSDRPAIAIRRKEDVEANEYEDDDR
jgi:hypothetical protein